MVAVIWWSRGADGWQWVAAIVELGCARWLPLKWEHRGGPELHGLHLCGLGRALFGPLGLEASRVRGAGGVGLVHCGSVTWAARLEQARHGLGLECSTAGAWRAWAKGALGLSYFRLCTRAVWAGLVQSKQL